MFARSHNTRQVCYQSSDLTNNQRGTGCLHSTHPDDHGKIDPNCAGFIFDFFLTEKQKQIVVYFFFSYCPG